jgi:sec-independent protein translocase protein TatA
MNFIYLHFTKTEKMLAQVLLYGMPSVWSIALIAVVVLLIFGGKKIPELMKGLGSGIKEFKKGVNEGDENKEDAKEIEDKK